MCMLNPYSFSDEIKRRPKVEVPPKNQRDRTEVMRKVPNWLTEVVNRDPCSESSRYLRYYELVDSGIPGIRETMPDL